jgi:hypothetical protein
MTQLEKKILTGVAIIAVFGIGLQIYNAYTFKTIKDKIVKQ